MQHCNTEVPHLSAMHQQELLKSTVPFSVKWLLINHHEQHSPLTCFLSCRQRVAVCRVDTVNMGRQSGHSLSNCRDQAVLLILSILAVIKQVSRCLKNPALIQNKPKPFYEWVSNYVSSWLARRTHNGTGKEKLRHHPEPDSQALGNFWNILWHGEIILWGKLLNQTCSRVTSAVSGKHCTSEKFLFSQIQYWCTLPLTSNGFLHSTIYFTGLP